MQRRVPQSIALACTVLLVALAAGCSLKRATAGARCTKPNDYAQDGTYVLKCSAGRWVRGITVDTADRALAALIAITTKPSGSLDSAAPADPGQLRVVGWAIDPETASPINVRVTVDGTAVVTAKASLDRPDLQTGKPELGTGHGFDVMTAAAEGTRQVCVIAQNTGRGTDTALGCRTVLMPPVSPTGTFEATSVGRSSITASGWANDPDVGGSPTVRVSWQGAGFDDPARVSGTADISRPDLAAFGIPTNRGWSITFSPDVPGPIQVCATVLNQSAGSDRSLGCRAVGYDDHRPQGSVDSVSPSSSGVTVSGWAADPDAAGSATVVVRVDGTPHSVVANQSRPDVGAAHPQFGSQRGWSTTIGSIGVGSHQVCVSITDLGAGGTGLAGDRTFACGTAIVSGSGSGTIAVGTSGAADPSNGVGPAPDHPLAGIDRDGGVSVTLSDGSTLWFFGDSSQLDGNGRLQYFVGNTAAWAPAATPTVTHDDLVSSPFTFVDPTGDFPACPSATDRQAEWPLSATVEHVGSTDHVVVFLENVCVSTGGSIAGRGIAVADWSYDPSHPPDRIVGGPGIRFTIQNQLLFAASSTTTGYGSGATAAGGLVYVYRCEGPANGGWPSEYGPCRVARTTFANVADASSYRFWNGSTWSSDASTAAALVMPDEPAGVVNPVASFTVSYDPAFGAYVMAYSPWPGYQSRAAVRFAASPVGPWTAPVEVQLPGCSDLVAGVGYYCYAITSQPSLSSPGHLGLGFYDQAASTNPLRGQYRATTVPMSVVVTP